MNKFKILTILLFITLGCKSYDDRFSAKDYKETKGEIEHDEIRYYDINGTKKKAKKLKWIHAGGAGIEEFFIPEL